MIKQGEKLSEARRQDILVRVNAYLEKHGITQAKVARELGIGHSTMSDLLAGLHGRRKGSWKTDDSEHLRKLNNWMELDARRRNIVHDPQYVETTVAKEIIAVAGYVAETCKIGVVFGPARIGKTMTLKAIEGDDRLGSPILFRVAEQHTTPRIFALAMGVALKLPRNGSLTEATERLVNKLEDTKRMLMIDEADRLNYRQLEWLRDLIDVTGCPLLLVGKDKIYEMLGFRHVGERREVLDQLRGRVAIRRDLTARTRPRGDGPRKKQPEPLFTREDIRKLISKAELCVKVTGDAVGWLQERACMLGTGGIGQTAILLYFANKLAMIKDMDAITRHVLEAVERDITYGDEDCSVIDEIAATGRCMEIPKVG